MEKISSYTWWWWKKSLIEVSTPFGHLKMSENLEKSVKIPQKNLKFRKKWVLPSQIPWNVQTYYHHTSYYVGHRFPIINTNRFIIHRCEFYLFNSNSSVHLFYDQSVTNVKTIFVPSTTKLQFYCEYNCERETTLCLRIIIITWLATE